MTIGHLELRAIPCKLVEREERRGWQNEKFNDFPNEVGLGEARLLPGEQGAVNLNETSDGQQRGYYVNNYYYN